MKTKYLGVLDRIEGNIAVILIGDEGDTLELPRRLLPEGSKEGDLISILLDKKDKKTKDEKARVKELIEKLSS